ncbi:hypothetical protein ACTXT7_006285 [Hymenolepis weldensis]
MAASHHPLYTLHFLIEIKHNSMKVGCVNNFRAPIVPLQCARFKPTILLPAVENGERREA